MKKWSLPPALCALCLLPASLTADDLRGAVPLTTEEIRSVFRNVRDDARVQDEAGTRAVNHWYADGRFTNSWSNDNASGSVQGRWRASDGKRCIVITVGLPDRIGRESCSTVLRRGDEYLSLNPDGSIHGIHRLSPISDGR